MNCDFGHSSLLATRKIKKKRLKKSVGGEEIASLNEEGSTSFKPLSTSTDGRADKTKLAYLNNMSRANRLLALS